MKEYGTCKVSNPGYMTGYVHESPLPKKDCFPSYGYVAVVGTASEPHSLYKARGPLTEKSS